MSMSGGCVFQGARIGSWALTRATRERVQWASGMVISGKGAPPVMKLSQVFGSKSSSVSGMVCMAWWAMMVGHGHGRPTVVVGSGVGVGVGSGVGSNVGSGVDGDVGEGVGTGVGSAVGEEEEDDAVGTAAVA